MRIGLVTDSTACLPPYRLGQLGVTVVPVQVTVGDQTFDEAIGINSQGVSAALSAGVDVTTSRPAPERFAQSYAQLQADGATEIVSVHLSSELSGTYSAAVLAARDAAIPVRVVDTRSVGLGLGFAVLAASNLLKLGGSAATAADTALEVGKHAKVWLAVDSLDSLRRGGRIGFAQATVGGALAIKPIVELVGGKLQPLEKVRTTSRAIARLVELAVFATHESAVPVQIGVQHAAAPERAQQLARELGKALPGVPVITTELGAVLTAHAGPGAIAVVVAAA